MALFAPVVRVAFLGECAIGALNLLDRRVIVNLEITTATGAQ
jgi:hypothetical protein